MGLVIKSDRNYFPFFLILGVFSLGLSSVIFRLMDAPSLLVASFRMMGASLIILPFCFKQLISTWSTMSVREKNVLILSSIVLGMHFYVWFESLNHTSIVNSVVLVTLNPLFVSLGGYFFLNEKEGKELWIGIFITIIGVISICIDDFDSLESETLYGDFLALLGGLMFSIYLLIGRSLRGSIPFLPYITFCYAMSGLFLFVLLCISGFEPVTFDSNFYFYLILMIFFPTLIGHTVINYALRKITSGKVAFCILGEPCVAIVLGAIILNEFVSYEKVFFVLIILLGVIVGVRKDVTRI